MDKDVIGLGQVFNLSTPIFVHEVEQSKVKGPG